MYPGLSQRPRVLFIKMGKKAQVTIFIILGIIIVSSIAVLFFLDRGEIETPNSPKTLGPRGFIQKCVTDIVEESEAEILANGMVPDPTLSIMYNGSNVTYHCYQANNYLPCYIVHPMLEDKIEEKLRQDFVSQVQDECFDILLQDFTNKGYKVEDGQMKHELDILPGEVMVDISKPITISKGDTSESYENFNTKIISPLHGFIQVARQISKSESKVCDFEYTGYSILYPEYRIKAITRDYSKVYIVRNVEVNKEFSMATRSCAVPAGLL